VSRPSREQPPAAFRFAIFHRNGTIDWLGNFQADADAALAQLVEMNPRGRHELVDTHVTECRCCDRTLNADFRCDACEQQEREDIRLQIEHDQDLAGRDA
jgi:tRNA(Ile2) C34 agmatinyltransferase TiaS